MEGSWLSSREQPAHLLGLMHALDAQTQRSKAHADIAFTAEIQSLHKGLLQDAVEFAHHLALVPEEALQILHPFKVGNDHTAGIAENVGDHEDFGTRFD